MQGTMIWFNLEKGFGFIRTEEDERLCVERGGFRDAQLPVGRCAGRIVLFERLEGEGEDGSRAVDVVFAEAADPRRARLRHARGGSSL